MLLCQVIVLWKWHIEFSITNFFKICIFSWKRENYGVL